MLIKFYSSKFNFSSVCPFHQGLLTNFWSLHACSQSNFNALILYTYMNALTCVVPGIAFKNLLFQYTVVSLQKPPKSGSFRICIYKNECSKLGSETRWKEKGMLLSNGLDLCGTWYRIEKLFFFNIWSSAFQNLPSVAYFVYRNKLSAQNLESKKDGVLKGKMNGAFKLSGIV